MDHLFIIVALVIASYVFTTHFRGRFSNLPPTIFPTIPIIGHLYLLKKPLYRSLAKISAKHGPILLLRFGSRRVLLVSSPSIAEQCFTKNDLIFANRPNWLYGKILGANYTHVAWASYGDHWRNLRRICTMEIFSSQRLNELREVRADEGKLLIHKLLSECSSPVNLKLIFHEVTLNMLMRMISGKRYFGGDLEEEGQQLHEIFTEALLMASVSNLEDNLPILRWFRVNGLEKRMIALQNRRSAFFQLLIQQLRNVNGVKMEKNSKKNTMIEVLFKLQETDPEYYTDELIRNLVVNLLQAGTDTTSSTMEWAFALLLNHTHILKKAQDEIDTNVGKHRLVDESDLTRLPYLRCIVNETMRLYPSSPLLLPHQSSQDCVVEGYHIPRGTMLLVNQWAIHHDPDLWSEPENFNPERFEKQERTRDHGFKFMPFGSGRRICPGDELAMRMIALTLGLLIQCFDWERNGEEKIDMTEGFGLTNPKAQPLVAKCTPRPATDSAHSLMSP